MDADKALLGFERGGNELPGELTLGEGVLDDGGCFGHCGGPRLFELPPYCDCCAKVSFSVNIFLVTSNSFDGMRLGCLAVLVTFNSDVIQAPWWGFFRNWWGIFTTVTFDE